MPKIGLLHISDVHEHSLPDVSHETLVSSIVSDLSRPSKKGFSILKPSLLVVCGDFIRGSANSFEDIEKQYCEAERFLEVLCDKAFNGDRERVVLVPGNHDVSWPYSVQSMTKIQSMEAKLPKMLSEPKNKVRWSWSDLSFYSISDTDRYNKRFELFTKFYGSFYKNKRKYSLLPDDQFDVFEYEKEKLLFVGFNSCFYNDHLNMVGMINPNCITSSYECINKDKYQKWVKIAVWHHGIHGFPMKNDFMDEHTIQFMIDKGFTVGLHGHQHKSDMVDVKFNADNLQGMFVFGCGTLSSPNEEIPYGETRQYSVLEIDTDKLTLRFHVRKDVNQSIGLPIWTPGNIPQNFNKSHIDIQINKPIYLARQLRKKSKDLLSDMYKELAEIDELVARKEFSKAFERLQLLDQTNAFVRRLTVECLFQLELNERLIEYVNDPVTVSEFSYFCDSLWTLKKRKDLRILIESKRDAREIANSEAFKKYDIKLKDAGL